MLGVTRRVLTASLALTLVGAGYPLPAIAAASAPTTLISSDWRLVDPPVTSQFPAVSGDGRYVAFVADADADGEWQVYLRDRYAGTEGTTSTVSLASDGKTRKDVSPNEAPAISVDGRYVAFVSSARDIVAGVADGDPNVYVRDMRDGRTIPVSVDSSGHLAGALDQQVSISADGRRIAFASQAALVATDTNAKIDVYVRSLDTSTTTLVSVSPGGQLGNGDSDLPSISSTGGVVAFQTAATDLVTPDANGIQSDVLVRDLVAGTTSRVSESTAGAQGDLDSAAPSISADGRIVAFYSAATNLIANDTNDSTDVFVRDRATGATTLISVNGAGAPGDGPSAQPSVSADGRFIAFRSDADDLTADAVGGYGDVYVRDRNGAGSTDLASKSSAGVPGNDTSEDPAISADGCTVAFDSNASNLVADDTNATTDVFAHERSRAASDLALKTTSATSLPYGATFAIEGTLTSDGVPLPAGRIVTLLSGSSAGSVGGSVATATTNAGGRFSFSVRPASQTYYRVVFGGDLDAAWSASTSTLYALPRSSVGTPHAPSRMSRSKSSTIYGYLKPHHIKGTYPVLIYRYRKVAGHWKPYGSAVKAKASDYKSYTKYSASVRLPYAGSWRVRAVAPADALHAKSLYSGYDYVTVR